MRRIIRILKCGYFVFFLSIFFHGRSSAYIDPATSSYIIQIIAAFFITLGVVFSGFSARAKIFFTKIQMKLLEEKIKKEATSNDGEDNEPKHGTVEYLLFDKRTLGSRIVLAAVSTFALTFTFFIFGICDLFIANASTIPYPFLSIALPISLFAFIVFAVLFLFASLLKGRVFNFFISLFFGLTLALYVQGNIVNIDLGQLTGDAIAWHNYKQQMLINLLMWLEIIALPFVIAYFSRVIWKYATIALSVLLVLVQVVTMLYSGFSSGVFVQKDSKVYLSEMGINEVSSKENIIVLLLDRLDGEYVEDYFKKNPNAFDNYEGFVQYKNNTSYYCRTYPAVVNLLTGFTTLYDKKADEFVSEAYKNSSFISDIRSMNYSTKFFMEKSYTYTNIEQLRDLADNVIPGTTVIDKTQAIKKFSTLTAFKYFPLALKPSFYISTDELTRLISTKYEYPSYVTDDVRYYNNLASQGLTVTDTKNNFMYLHLNGLHAPYDMTENCESAPSGGSSLEAQMAGCMKIVSYYLDELKRVGLYDSSNIIITGDHGKSYDFTPLDRAVTTGLFVKLKGEKGALRVNTAPINSDNFRASVIKMTGIKTDSYGPAFWEVDENADITRKYYYRVTPQNGKEEYLEEFNIKGDARNFKNWEKVGETISLYPHG